MDPHYISLILAYGSGMILWWLINNQFPLIWSNNISLTFKNPLFEFILSILSVVLIILLGQLYNYNLLIPDRGIIYLNAINQLIIFSPSILLVLIRRQSPKTIWLPKNNILLRILSGFGITACSFLVYWFSRNYYGDYSFTSTFLNIFHHQNLSFAVQIFMEDVTIALIFVRLQAWIGRRYSIIIVAILFAVGHIPTMIFNGADIVGLSTLLLDSFLGIIVLLTLSKSRDISWFFILHFTMDMTQFYFI